MTFNTSCRNRKKLHFNQVLHNFPLFFKMTWSRRSTWILFLAICIHTNLALVILLQQGHFCWKRFRAFCNQIHSLRYLIASRCVGTGFVNQVSGTTARRCSFNCIHTLVAAANKDLIPGLDDDGPHTAVKQWIWNNFESRWDRVPNPPMEEVLPWYIDITKIFVAAALPGYPMPPLLP